MTEEDALDVVIAALKTIAPEIEHDELRRDRPLRNQVDLDSMDWLNFLLGLNKRLGIEIPEADYAQLITLDDVVAYLMKKLR
jgi:acyl carrier protein